MNRVQFLLHMGQETSLRGRFSQPCTGEDKVAVDQFKREHEDPVITWQPYLLRPNMPPEGMELPAEGLDIGSWEVPRAAASDAGLGL